MGKEGGRKTILTCPTDTVQTGPQPPPTNAPRCPLASSQHRTVDMAPPTRDSCNQTRQRHEVCLSILQRST
ncbi:hypothetical protein XENORESO_022185 [Xenotaenia resolanae]|uniref:Uncharacterized protein n=1 Tax=Xenotaenia resolanae TaxID=208358 RepID=A0ABV0WZG6_9TELE